MASKRLRLTEIEGIISQIQDELHRLTTGEPCPRVKNEEKRKKQEQEREAKKQKMLQQRLEKLERKRIQKLHRQVMVDITVTASHTILQSLLDPSPPLGLSPHRPHLSSFCLFSSPALHGVGSLGGFGTCSDLVASRASHIKPVQKACNAAAKKIRKDSLQKIVSYLEQRKPKKKKGEVKDVGGRRDRGRGILPFCDRSGDEYRFPGGEKWKRSWRKNCGLGERVWEGQKITPNHRFCDPRRPFSHQFFFQPCY